MNDYLRRLQDAISDAGRSEAEQIEEQLRKVLATGIPLKDLLWQDNKDTGIRQLVHVPTDRVLLTVKPMSLLPVEPEAGEGS